MEHQLDLSRLFVELWKLKSDKKHPLSYLIGENLKHFEEIWGEIDSNCLK
jgi:hypothetical protein